MNRILLNTVVFLLGLFALLFILGEILEIAALKVDPNEPKVQEVISLKNQTYNTLILGNSITQQGINPIVMDSILKTKSYNMAIGGASIFSMELVLRNYIAHNEKPKSIIYGLYVNEKEWPDKVRPTLLAGLEDSIVANHYDTNPDVLGTGSMAFYNRFKAFRYRNVIEHYLKYSINPKLYSYNYSEGFLIRNAVAKPITSVPPNKAGLNLKALQRLIDFCAEQDIAVTLVELPNHQAFNATTTNRDTVLYELNSVLSAGVKYLNLNTPEKYTLEDWASLNHLNAKGAKKFSAILAETLKANKPRE